MVQNKIKDINDILHSFPTDTTMGLEYIVDLGKESQKNYPEEDIKKYLEVDVLLYQEIDDLVEAVTRIGDHHIDNPCMACLDGHYVINGRKVHELVKE